MARSLSLAAYMALARRGGGEGGFAPSAERPEGALIWGHATSLEHADALACAATLKGYVAWRNPRVCSVLLTQ